MNVLDWLCDRRRNCADCALYAAQTRDLRSDMIILIDEVARLEMAGNDLIAGISALIRERDGLRRELAMERMRASEKLKTETNQ